MGQQLAVVVFLIANIAFLPIFVERFYQSSLNTVNVAYTKEDDF